MQDQRPNGTPTASPITYRGMTVSSALEPFLQKSYKDIFAQTAMFENGRVFLPLAASWLADYLHELTSFPGSRYDDQVDSTTQFLDYIGVDNSLEIWVKLGQG